MIISTKRIFVILTVAIAAIVFLTVILILINIGKVGGKKTEARLEFWGVFDDRQDFANVVQQFQRTEKTLNVKINYRQFSYEDYEHSFIEALAAGQGPDILIIHHTWLAKYRGTGILAPMPESVEVDEESGQKPFLTAKDFEQQFVDVAYKDLVYQNKIYALPLYVDTLALYYNRDMFNVAGITRPPRDWEEFSKDVELLTKFDRAGNIIQAGAAMGTARNINRSTDILAALMIQNGTKMNNASDAYVSFSRSVNSERVGENAVQYYTDFANPGKTVYSWNDSQHYSIDAFVEGKVAMMFNYSHQIPVLRKKLARLNFSIAPLPQVSDLDTKNYANYWAVAVTRSSKNQEAAWRFLMHLTSKEGASLYLSRNDALRPAARRDLIDIQRNDPQLGLFALQALTARSWHQVDHKVIETILADMIDDVNYKRASIRNALQTAEAKINTLISRRPQ